jgi:hypothetical protein
MLAELVPVAEVEQAAMRCARAVLKFVEGELLRDAAKVFRQLAALAGRPEEIEGEAPPSRGMNLTVAGFDDRTTLRNSANLVSVRRRAVAERRTKANGFHNYQHFGDARQTAVRSPKWASFG